MRVHASKGIKVQKYCTHGGRVSHLSTFLTLCSGTLITENSPLITPSALDFQAANRAISAPSASRQQSRLRRRCSASTAVNFDSSELFARCGRSLLWLEQRLRLTAKTSDRHRHNQSDLCSTLLLFRCIYSRVAAGTSPIPRHKKPESLKLAFSGLRHKPGAGWPESAIP